MRWWIGYVWICGTKLFSIRWWMGYVWICGTKLHLLCCTASLKSHGPVCLESALCGRSTNLLECNVHMRLSLEHHNGNEWWRCGSRAFPCRSDHSHPCSRLADPEGQHHHHHHHSPKGLCLQPSGGRLEGEPAAIHSGDLSPHRHHLHRVLRLRHESQAQAGHFLPPYQKIPPQDIHGPRGGPVKESSAPSNHCHGQEPTHTV